MAGKSSVWKLLYAMRDLRSKDIFNAMKKYCKGIVLDVGGWDFFTTIQHNKKIKFDQWVILESEKERLFEPKDERFKLVHGDGCNMPFEDNTFDVVINIQVLEHVFEPMKMIKEI